jgi:cyclic pyranopterin phosphate synthase
VTDFSHIDERGGVRMVDVGGKPISRRRATARARIEMRPETAARLSELPKGDALTTAQIAGVMAAKRTSELIPLCHPLPLSVVDVTVAIIENGADVTSTVETTAQTGVEMDALIGAAVAALTIYDMAKAVDDSMVVGDVRLVEKTKEEL